MERIFYLNYQHGTVNIAKNCPILSAFFSFLANIAQSTESREIGKEVNACTIIAVRYGDYCKQQNLGISLLWNQLPNVCVDSFVNAIFEGNALYEESYGDTAVRMSCTIRKSNCWIHQCT